MILLKALIISFQSIISHLLVAGLGNRKQQWLDVFCHFIHSIIKLIGVDTVITANGNADLRIIIYIKSIFRQIQIACHSTVSEGRGTAGHIHEQGCADIANHREFMIFKGFQGIFMITLGNNKCFTKDRICNMGAIDKAFVGLFRHSAAQQPNLRHRLRNVVELINTLRISTLGASKGIHRDYALHIHNTGNLRDLIHIFLTPAIGVQQPKVKHIRFIHEPLSCFDHIRFRCTQAHKDRRAQCNDQNDGNIAGNGFQNGLLQIFAHYIFTHYHSSSDTF